MPHSVEPVQMSDLHGNTVFVDQHDLTNNAEYLRLYTESGLPTLLSNINNQGATIHRSNLALNEPFNEDVFKRMVAGFCNKEPTAQGIIMAQNNYVNEASYPDLALDVIQQGFIK